MFDIRRFGGVVAVTCALAASTVGLVGCGPARPDSATALAAKMREVGVMESGHVDGSIDISLGAGGFSLDVPMDVSGDFCGKASHLNMSSEKLGVSSESYTAVEGNKSVNYSKSEGSLLGLDTGSSSSGSEWTKSETEIEDDADLQGKMDDIFSDDIVSMADFKANDDGTYTLAFGKDAVEAVSKKLGDAVEDADVMGMSLDANAVGDANIEVTVSEDFRIKAVSGDMSASYEMTEDASGDLSMKFGLSFSKVGEVSESDVAVPKEVVDSAKDMSSLFTDMTDDIALDVSDEDGLRNGADAGANAALQEETPKIDKAA